MRRRLSISLAVLAIGLARATMGVNAAARAHVSRRASTCDLYASASTCVDVSLPRRLARDVTFVTRARVPDAIDVQAPRESGTSFLFYVLATNDTRVVLEKRREERRGGGGGDDFVRDGATTTTSVFTTSMKMRTFANDENEDKEDEDESWTLVDAITGMGDRSWVVFDACDDARIGADASPRAFRFRLRTVVVETSPRDARETNASTSTSSSSSFARVAVIAATNHRRASASRRCARYARR